MLIKTHKTTSQILLLKKDRGIVSTLFVLDEDSNKIKDGRDVKRELSYKIAICLSKNLN